MSRGKFIVVEGIDGAGKSTQAILLANRLREEGRTVHPMREPGGTLVGEEIRTLLLDPTLPMDERTQVLLFTAARAELMKIVVKKLESGDDVVMDRWAYSTYAYQHIIHKLEWEAMTEFVSRSTWPDLVLLLDLPVIEAKARTAGGPKDRFESQGVEYFARVRARYDYLTKTMINFRIIDATQSREAVAEEIWRKVRTIL